ncbi:uncharacterized protein UV8b_01780 [Ustilaginoidea virens]|uniref:Aminoglycoside phosphotransferase domain-containing protein n=2 Tax=Ustilaginoidea virens TaxID=1159556 RepID=A0A8E5HL88_USTVR|nr:uncharacterized protein UV8b_01780 [Ustilaginoidea virens]QUC17539.1 hypothetical protein UV8b_01780 [Ustilaginoidea virens]
MQCQLPRPHHILAESISADWFHHERLIRRLSDCDVFADHPLESQWGYAEARLPTLTVEAAFSAHSGFQRLASSDSPSSRDGMSHKAVRNGILARAIVLLVFKIMKTRLFVRWFPQPNCIVYVTSKICIKSTSFTSLAEAEAMKFVSSATTVPVPKVFLAFEHKKRVYIVMERLPGRSLDYGWAQRSAESKARIFDQLRSMVQEIRKLQPPQDCGVSNVCGGPIFDPRLPKSLHWGPFRSIRHFHRELRNGIELDAVKDVSTLPEGLENLIKFHEQPWDKPVFTHGDLSSLNIIADGDTVVGIIDWETAGWLPPYWEYTCAWDANPQNWFWQQEVDNFLEARPHDLEMETIRKRYFGAF